MKLKSILLLLLLAVPMLLLVACKEERQTSDLLTAIDKGQSDVVQELLDSGIDPNIDAGPVGTPLAGAYPLHLAALNGDKEIVQILLDNGAKIDLRATNKDEATPLAWASFHGQKDVVSLLIEAGAPINALDAAGIAWRASQDDEEKAKKLMEIMTILKDNGGKHTDEP